MTCEVVSCEGINICSARDLKTYCILLVTDNFSSPTTTKNTSFAVLRLHAKDVASLLIL